MHRDRVHLRDLAPVAVSAALASAGLLAACGTTTPAGRPAAPVSGTTAAARAGNTPDSRVTAVLQQSWSAYKTAFIQADGRVVDPARGGITTSEGQSYALLRAVWMGDRPAFDLSWRWTVHNLQVRGDGAFASLWGGGAVQDNNTASDADSDIALALLYASRRFSASSYRDAALTVLGGVWEDDVTTIGGMQVLTGGNWASRQQQPGPVLNPSYFAPYAYRVFAREDGAHPWATLVDTSYTMLGRCSSARLGASSSVGLPPNWCAVSRASGDIVSFPQISGADNYGYDAFRVMWRVALDATWNNEQRAHDYLAGSDFLRQRWTSAQRLDPVYGHDGSVVSGEEDVTVYGGDIGNFLVADPATAPALLDKLMATFNSSAAGFFGDRTNYYEQNWVWFGIALAGGALPDLGRENL